MIYGSIYCTVLYCTDKRVSTGPTRPISPSEGSEDEVPDPKKEPRDTLRRFNLTVKNVLSVNDAWISNASYRPKTVSKTLAPRPVCFAAVRQWCFPSPYTKPAPMALTALVQ